MKNKDQICAKIAKALRDFGYPDVDAAMVGEIVDARAAGNELPHGVIGMFANSMLSEAGL